jgi:hypothetical protein
MEPVTIDELDEAPLLLSKKDKIIFNFVTFASTFGLLKPLRYNASKICLQLA